VTDVLYRYASGIDLKDWSLLRRCFVDDCRLDYGDIGRWDRADEVVEWMRQTHEGLSHTLHRVTNPVVSIGLDGRATAQSYVHAMLVHPLDPNRPIHAYGRYMDVLEKVDGAWKIATRQFVMAYAGQEAGPPPGI
jgi:3-phenylpropionate/cinnamic acid dioxygenase small subunit